MIRQRLPHEHRSLRFRVVEPSGQIEKFSPAIAARRGPILFLVEPMAPVTKRSIARLTAFLEQHSPDIILVAVCQDAKTAGVPQEAYDEIYAESDIAKMTRRIRTQNPEGIVRPFVKPPL